MNLLVTGAWSDAGKYLKHIEQCGHAVAFLQYEKENLPCPYDWVEGVICNGLFLYHSIEKFVNLKYIQLTSAGFDRVPMDYVREKLLEIHNAKGVYSIPMAEFAVGSVLQLYKQKDFFRKNQENHIWEKHRNVLELYEKKVCIVGCGSVGTECAKRFQAFGCEITGVDLFLREDINYNRMVSLQELESVLSKADILILTLPLTEETRHLMNAQRFALMKDGAVIVNIARGAVIETAALVREMNRLGGAVLDVFEEEPLDEHSPFWDMEHVLITPHNSFVGDNNRRRLAEVILNTLKERR